MTTPTGPATPGPSQWPPPIPAIPPSVLRPSRWWYLIAGLIAFLGVCCGAGGFVLGIGKTLSDVDEIKTSRLDTPFVVSLDNNDDLALYLEHDGSVNRSDLSCTGRGLAGGDIDFTDSDVNLSTSWGDDTKTLIFEIDISESGRYEIACTGDRLDSSSRVIVGHQPNWLAGGLGIAALFGAPCLGLILAGIVCLIVALRRKSHKERLLREYATRATDPGQGPPSSL